MVNFQKLYFIVIPDLLMCWKYKQTCHLVILGHMMILNFAIDIFAAILPKQVLSYALLIASNTSFSSCSLIP